MPLVQGRLNQNINERLLSMFWERPLTVHLDPSFPLFLLKAVLGLDTTSWCGRWGSGFAPIWREEFYVSVGNQ